MNLKPYSNLPRVLMTTDKPLYSRHFGTNKICPYYTGFLNSAMESFWYFGFLRNLLRVAHCMCDAYFVIVFHKLCQKVYMYTICMCDLTLRTLAL